MYQLKECGLEVTTVDSKSMAKCLAGSNPATPMCVRGETVERNRLKICDEETIQVQILTDALFLSIFLLTYFAIFCSIYVNNVLDTIFISLFIIN